MNMEILSQIHLLVFPSYYWLNIKNDSASISVDQMGKKCVKFEWENRFYFQWNRGFNSKWMRVQTKYNEPTWLL